MDLLDLATIIMFVIFGTGVAISIMLYCYMNKKESGIKLLKYTTICCFLIITIGALINTIFMSIN